MIDITHLNKLIDSGNTDELIKYMKIHNLKLTDDNKIVCDKATVDEAFAYWDKRQLVKKILLNSALV